MDCVSLLPVGIGLIHSNWFSGTGAGEWKMSIPGLQLGAMALLLGLLCAMPAAAQRGRRGADRCRSTGREATDQDHVGIIKDIKTGPCERTTGALEGVHLLVQAESGKTINATLGPEAALEDVLDQLSAGQQISFEAFRTDAMPQDAYVAKSLKAGDTTFDLRDDSLRPSWAIAARGGPRRRTGHGRRSWRGRGPGQRQRLLLVTADAGARRAEGRGESR